MDHLLITPSKSTPSVEFEPETQTLSFVGESYPENAAGFYEPIYEWLNAFLVENSRRELHVLVELIYFNSSSSKALMNLFDCLDAAAKKDWSISVSWRYQRDNEIIQESGEEFREDYESLVFTLEDI